MPPSSCCRREPSFIKGDERTPLLIIRGLGGVLVGKPWSLNKRAAQVFQTAAASAEGASVKKGLASRKLVARAGRCFNHYELRHITTKTECRERLTNREGSICVVFSDLETFHAWEESPEEYSQ